MIPDLGKMTELELSINGTNTPQIKAIIKDMMTLSCL